MKSTSTTLILSALIVFLLTSCVTYHVTTQSLLEQFVAVHQEMKPNIPVFPLVFLPGVVEGNDLKRIKVLDKKDSVHYIYVTNRTGVRITKLDCTKTTFYFDTMIIKDSTITGCKTHFVPSHIKPIKLSNIKKIEIQE